MSAALEVIETGEIVEAMTAEEASSITTRITVKLDAIADNYESVMPLIREAITRQAHTALGYRSAGEYAADRFGDALSRLGIDTRRAVVKELTEAGLSTRAIAPIVGVSHETVRSDAQSGVKSLTPAPRAASACSDCGNVLAPGETCEGCYPPAYDADTDAWADDDEPALTDEECRALADPAGLVDDEPEAESRVTGIDGKSYPATAPRKPNRRPITDAFWTATYDLEKKVTTLTNLATDDRFKSNADQIRDRNLNDLIRARDALQGVIDQLTQGA